MKKHQLEQRIGQPAPMVMGVLNITPDSFADGGAYLAPEDAVTRANEMIDQGAHLIDIGGESTAPGSQPISPEEELARIEAVVGRLAPHMPLSIDTYRAPTAARCLELGAVMINDVSALRADSELAAVVREHKALLAMTHVKDAPLPHASEQARHYQDIIAEIGDFLQARIDTALDAGIHQDCLVVDPGWGRFISLDPADSWTLLACLEKLVERLAPVPLMMGTSRKGFLGVPLDERAPLSELTALIGVTKGAALIRTHQPKMTRQFLDAAVKMQLLA